MPQATLTTLTSDEPDRRVDVVHALVALVTAVVAPPLITLLYLLAADVARDVTKADGYARASLDLGMYAGYTIVLGIFVLAGTWWSRGTVARLLFAVTSLAVSLVAMFLAFFGQMAP